jgi:hypothetical protein
METKRLKLQFDALQVESFATPAVEWGLEPSDTTDACKPGPTLKNGPTCLFGPGYCV